MIWVPSGLKTGSTSAPGRASGGPSCPCRYSSRLCELLDTSEAMVRKHYNHLFERTETLRESLDEFDAAGAPAQHANVTSDESPPLAS
jgi:hypothetical protein